MRRTSTCLERDSSAHTLAICTYKVVDVHQGCTARREVFPAMFLTSGNIPVTLPASCNLKAERKTWSIQAMQMLWR